MLLRKAINAGLPSGTLKSLKNSRSDINPKPCNLTVRFICEIPLWLHG